MMDHRETKDCRTVMNRRKKMEGEESRVQGLQREGISAMMESLGDKGLSDGDESLEKDGR